MFKLLLALGVYAEMDAKAEADGSARDLTPRYVEMNVIGAKIVGKYIAARTLKGKNEGTYLQYTFETDEGPAEFHCGAYFDGHAGALMAKGGVYAISFLGTEKIESSGNTVNKFTCKELLAASGK